jgi:L-asparaginase II
MTFEPPAAAVVTRAAGIDAWHFACVAVVDGDGRITHAVGNPELVTFARSAIKPFQVLPLLMSGACDALGIDDEEIALAAGSHDGSDLHRSVAARLLAKAGLDSAALQCGAHWPIGLRGANRYPLAGEDRDPLRNNCSGKHAGFLALARTLGVPPESYLRTDSAVQRMVTSAVAGACEIDETRLLTGVDGCGAPNFAMPLSALARGIKNLATRESSGAPLDAALERVRKAMQAHPMLASGEKRFDHEMMRAFGKRAVCKVGAEGLQAIGFSDPPLGIVVKILDGADRALPPICMAILSQLGLIGTEPPLELAGRVRPVVRNHQGLESGLVMATPVLTPVGGARVSSR